MPPLKDLTGQTFGRLTISSREATRATGRTQYLCLCECGAQLIVAGCHLVNGHTQSCGCLRKETGQRRPRTHGHTINRKPTPEYMIWGAMRKRCLNPNDQAFPSYGGRGITVCKRWLHSFEAFYTDMGPRPSPTYSIERISNDGPYSPENCRWATRTEQNRNSRHNIMITWNNATHCLKEWCEILGLSYSVIQQRYAHEWTPERMFTTPVRKIRTSAT